MKANPESENEIERGFGYLKTMALLAIVALGWAAISQQLAYRKMDNSCMAQDLPLPDSVDKRELCRCTVRESKPHYTYWDFLPLIGDGFSSAEKAGDVARESARTCAVRMRPS